MFFQAPLRVQFSAAIAILLLLGLIIEYKSSYLFSDRFHKISASLFSSDDAVRPVASASDFWATIAPTLAAAAPRCRPPVLAEKAKANFMGGKRNLLKNLEMSDGDVESMRRSHMWFVDWIRNHSPTMAFEPGTRGIVTSAGGAYFPVLLVSLRFLRRTGSILPVEVFLATPNEYEPLVCETILPALNAKCIVLSDIVDAYTLPFLFDKYQLKIFSILFSSFESVLFLDADNFPVRAPENLFDSEPYLSENLVLWPDYWSSTVSPQFITIAGLEEGVLENRPTIEAGQLLVSKSKQAETLLLAAYYNCYADYYYHLLSQGGPGEGDKDTFAAAALVLDAPLYTVHRRPIPFGIRNQGAAVLQADPMEDFDNNGGTPRPLFIHASWPPKLNALHNQRDVRQWGSEENSKKLFGEDMEPIAWGYMVDMACEEGLEFKDWGNGNKSNTTVCEQTRHSFHKMFGRNYGE